MVRTQTEPIEAMPQTIHQAMLKARYADKIAGHISRDATAIHAR